jgi:hypothetical protein
MRLKNLDYLRAFIIIFAVIICVSCSLTERKGLHANAQETNTNQNQNDNTNLNNNQNQIEKLSTPTDSLRPKILSRQEWKAKDAIGVMQQHTIKHITIHHTASPQKEGITIEKKMQNLQNFSQSESRLASGKIKPVWADVPYHYYIAVDGQIAEGRDIRYVGDTNTDYDPRGHALIVVEGNFEKEQPSLKQQTSLLKLVAWISANYEVSVSEIKGHNDYASTACPGINLKKLLPTLREKLLKSESP